VLSKVERDESVPVRMLGLGRDGPDLGTSQVSTLSNPDTPVTTRYAYVHVPSYKLRSREIMSESNYDGWKVV